MENVEQKTIKMEEMRKQPSRLEVIGTVITVGVLGFWFGTTKNPKKVEAGKRLAESNCKKREAKKQAKLEARGVNQY